MLFPYRAAAAVVITPKKSQRPFFASDDKISRYENRMAAGYDDNGLPVPGKFPLVPDLAASGLWSTPKDLLILAKEFIRALHGESTLLQQKTAKEMAEPVDRFPWTGLGLFTDGDETLVSKGWGENGQCIMKMNFRTNQAAVVMTNQNPGADQRESGIEWLADSKLKDREYG